MRRPHSLVVRAMRVVVLSVRLVRAVLRDGGALMRAARVRVHVRHIALPARKADVQLVGTHAQRWYARAHELHGTDRATATDREHAIEHARPERLHLGGRHKVARRLRGEHAALVADADQ